MPCALIVHAGPEQRCKRLSRLWTSVLDGKIGGERLRFFRRQTDIVSIRALRFEPAEHVEPECSSHGDRLYGRSEHSIVD